MPKPASSWPFCVPPAAKLNQHARSLLKCHHRTSAQLVWLLLPPVISDISNNLKKRMLQKLRKGCKMDFKLWKAESLEGHEFCPILFYAELIFFCLCCIPPQNRIDSCHARTTACALLPRACSALILPAAWELSNICLPVADAFHRCDLERVCAHLRKCADR